MPYLRHTQQQAMMVEEKIQIYTKKKNTTRITPTKLLPKRPNFLSNIKQLLNMNRRHQKKEEKIN